MIVKKLELVNFQVIKDFKADFEGNVYFITGDNELGKSTILKAIGALLTGNRDEVLKNGEDKGFAKMVVGDDGEEYDVELRFTKANPRGKLTIKQKTTGMKSDNISMLNKIFGYTDFDAVEFSRWSETAEGRRKQIEIVKSLLPVEVNKRINEIDIEVNKDKEERKDINRDLKRCNAALDEITKKVEPGDVEKYTEKLDISALIEEQKTNAQLIEKAKTVRATREKRKQQLAEIDNRIEEENRKYEEELKSISDDEGLAKVNYKIALDNAKKELEAKEKECKERKERLEKSYNNNIDVIYSDKADFEKRISNADLFLKNYEVNNPEKFDTEARLQEVELHNKKYEKVQDFKNREKQLEQIVELSDNLDSKINGLLNERAKIIENSKLPISGLTFTDEGLELKGVPFIPGKVSDSQIMEVATKLIIASNPKVKVFRIARGESLGENRLKTIIEVAKKNGFQGFIEEVHRGQDDLIVEEYAEK